MLVPPASPEQGVLTSMPTIEPNGIIGTSFDGENPRRARCVALAARVRIREERDHWTTPSASGDGRYSVYLPEPRCTCPDHQVPWVPCRHIFAVKYARGAPGSPWLGGALGVSRVMVSSPIPIASRAGFHCSRRDRAGARSTPNTLAGGGL